MHSRILKYRIYAMLDQYEQKILDYYLKHGPLALKQKLDIKDDDIWTTVFDYLIFEKEAVKFCVRKYSDYVHALFKEHGPMALRENFLIDAKKYDDAWQYVMEFIGISRGAIFEYVTEHKNEFKDLIYKGETSQIRNMLLLNGKNYNRIWEEILDLLLECVSFENINYSMFDHGLKLFSNFYNTGRKHRSIKRLRAAES